MNMDWSIVSSLGSAAAAVIVVLLFLRYLNTERRSCDKREAAQFDSLKNIGADCHQHAARREERMIECIDRSTSASDRNLEIQGQVLEVIRTLNGAK